MLVKFDSLNRYETPLFHICNPGCEIGEHEVLTNTIGVISDTSDEEIVFNFNAKSELNFRAYKRVMDDAEQDAHFADMFDALEARRLIYLEGIGFFSIDDVSVEYDDYVTYKDVKASSCEAEIENKQIPYFADGTYPFSTQGTTQGLLEKMVEALPLWQINHVDNAVSVRYRTFEDIDESTNIYSFMLKNMQDAYECIFVFDIERRYIDVYDRDTYVVESSVHLTKDDLIQSVQIEETSDDLYTAITVSGDDESINIAAVNPLGTRTIYNFDYYLDWMTPVLRTKVEEWQAKVDGYADEYYQDSVSYYGYMTSVSNYNSEIARLDVVIDMYKRCRDNIVAEASTRQVPSYNAVIISNGGIPIPTTGSIAELKAQIDTLISDATNDRNTAVANRNAAQSSADAVNQEMQDIRDDVSFSNNFQADLYEELMNYIYEGSYSDEYITVTDIMSESEKLEQMKTLYDRAVTQLTKLSQPTYKFTIDVENFLFQKEFSHATEELETGCLINVELDTNDIAELFLSTIQLNWFDHQLSLTFGNRYNKFDPEAMFDSVLGNVKRSANAINYIKDLVSPIANGELNELQMAIDNSRNLTKNMALTATDNEVQIDDTGYLGRKLLNDGTYDPEQIKIVNNSIVFTDDAWDTAKTAVGKIVLADGSTVYGVNAEVLIGNLIVGERLHIGGIYVGARNFVLGSGDIKIVNDGQSAVYDAAAKSFSVTSDLLSSSGEGDVTVDVYPPATITVDEDDNERVTPNIYIGESNPNTIIFDLSSTIPDIAQGKTFILSFYAYAPNGGTVAAALYNGDTAVTERTDDVTIEAGSETVRYVISDITVDDLDEVKNLRLYATANSGYMVIKNVQLEFGNSTTSWEKAPEDMDGQIADLATIVHNHGSALDVVQDQISSRVWEEDITTAIETVNGEISDIDVRVTRNESSIVQNARAISLKVSSSDYNGNTIASLINQTATTVAIDASKINLTGAVTISTFGADVASKIANMEAATSAAQLTANSKSKTFQQDSAPTSGVNAGDIWYNTGDGNKMYRYNGTSWISVQDSQVETDHAIIQSWAADNNFTYIDGAMIATGTLLVDQIKLYGKMNVYESAASGTVGGYIGYMEGMSSSGNSTNGIAAMSPTRSDGTYNYVIATDSGVRLTHVYQGSTYNNFNLSGNAAEFQRNGKTLIQFLSADSNRGGLMVARNTSEDSRVIISADTGSSSTGYIDSGQVVIYAANSDSSHTTGMKILSTSNSNNVVANVGTNGDGVGYITVKNASGSNRVAIASNTTDGGVVRLYNAGGTSYPITYSWITGVNSAIQRSSLSCTLVNISASASGTSALVYRFANMIMVSVNAVAAQAIANANTTIVKGLPEAAATTLSTCYVRTGGVSYACRVRIASGATELTLYWPQVALASGAEIAFQIVYPMA